MDLYFFENKGFTTEARRARRFEAAGNCVCNGTPRNRKWIGYTPVVTGSMRNRLRSQGIEALRGACEGGREARRGSVGYAIPGVCVRVAGKGLTRHGVRKSGKQRTYKEAFLHFSATEAFRGGEWRGTSGEWREGAVRLCQLPIV